MAKKATKSKSKPKAGKSVKSTAKTKPKGGKLKTAGKLGMAIGKNIPVVGGAFSAAEEIGGILKPAAGESVGSGKTAAAAIGRTGKHRRRTVPKAVQKWVRKTVRRKKTENKMMGHMLSMTGAKRAFGQKKGISSVGSITTEEAIRALRR